jgi:hypothetical protein
MKVTAVRSRRADGAGSNQRRIANATAGELNPAGGLRRQRMLQRVRLKRHCFLRFVIVFVPSAPVVAEKLTRSPAWMFSND